MPNFADILDTPSAEIQPPKPIPAGSYVCRVVGMPEHGESSQKKTPYVRFNVTPLEALDDVALDELKESLGDEPLGNVKLFLDFYITEKSIYRLKKFLANDLLIDDEGKTLRQMLDEVQGAEFIASVSHRPSTRDPEVYFSEIGSTAPVS